MNIPQIMLEKEPTATYPNPIMVINVVPTVGLEICPDESVDFTHDINIPLTEAYKLRDFLIANLR